MVYRQSKSAIDRARERLVAAKERLELVRAQVDLVSMELSDAQRKRELVRLEVGAATARVRQIEALIAAGSDAAELEARLADATARLEAARARIPVCELTIGERREELRSRRRELGAVEIEHAEAERELRRLADLKSE